LPHFFGEVEDVFVGYYCLFAGGEGEEGDDEGDAAGEGVLLLGFELEVVGGGRGREGGRTPKVDFNCFFSFPESSFISSACRCESSV
jgi:hypothetical protein